MCLDQLYDFEVKKDKDGIGVGWQIFFVRTTGLKPLYRIESYSDRSVPVNCWEKDPKSFMLRTEKADSSYMTGFHIFLSKSDAIIYSETLGHITVRQVLFKNVSARGMQGTKAVVVARDRFVREE